METAIGIAGLFFAFDGAVKGYALVEELLRSDVGVQDRVLKFERIKSQLEEWGAAFYVNSSRRNEDCLFKYMSVEDQATITSILDRIDHHLEKAKDYLENHTRVESEKNSSWRPRMFSSKDGSKNRGPWVLKNKATLDAIIAQLEEHLKNLIQSTKRVAILRQENWERRVRELTKIDERKLHTGARNSRQEGTCQWLFERPEYKDWMSGKDENFLWINATPGRGKTVLASAVIDELEKVTSQPGANTGLAYFYCDYKDRTRQTLAELFGCLTAQLTRQNLAIRHAIWHYLSSFQNMYVPLGFVQYEELVKRIVNTCETFDRIYLVIDAADEFLPVDTPGENGLNNLGDCKTLLRNLKELSKDGEGKIKVLVTSRPTAQIQEILKSVPRVSMSAESNSKDIEMYVCTELEKEMKDKTSWGEKLIEGEQQNPTVKSLIVSSLVEKADGMFLFTVLQLQILLGCHTGENVIAILEELPPDIDHTWERLLLDINTAQKLVRYRETIKKILQWLVAAVRPLTLNEMWAAVGTQGFGNNNSEWLIGLCGPLVRLSSHETPDKQELSLAHFSLKEFLLDRNFKEKTSSSIHGYSINLSDANAYLATVSLTYLSSPGVVKPYNNRQELDQIRQEHKLLDYSILHGGMHLRSVEHADAKLIELLEALLIPEITWHDLGNQYTRPDGIFKATFTAFLPPQEDDFTRLVGNFNVSINKPFPEDVAEALLPRLGEQLMKSIEEHPNCRLFLHLFRALNDPTRKDHPVNVTPLYYASLFGWKAGVEKLLRINENRVTTTDLNHALRAAAVGGFLDIIELLHKAGADVNAHMGALGSPLQSATFCGQEQVVQKLLSLGALTNEEDSYYRPGGTVGSSLQGAAMSGNIKLVQALIDGGADINSNKGWLGTALQAVLEGGKQDMARFLISHKDFNPNVTGGYYGSACRVACLQGGLSMNDLLGAIFDRGGSPSERVGPYGSLLEIVSHFGHLEKAKLLLDRGAQLDNTSLGPFGNAIHAAAMHGNDEIVRLLLDHGADPNCPGHWLGRDYAQAVPRHSEYGRCLVLQQGVGFLAYDHSYILQAFFAPLLNAAMRLKEVDHNKIFMFFENEPTHRDAHLGNPLQAAAFRGHTSAMRLLIERGAKVNETDGFFGTALQAAASQGHLEAVNTLLDKGADSNNCATGHYGTALAAAVALKFSEIVLSLLDKGANPRSVDEHGWSANTWCTLHDWLPDARIQERLEKVCKSPSAWSLTNRSPKLHVDNSGCGVRLLGEVLKLSVQGRHFLTAASLIADHPISPYKDFYFEVEIQNQGSSQVIAVGLSEKDVSTFKLPGHAAPRWGFRGDDGGCFQHKPKEGLTWPHGASWGYHGDDGHCYAAGQQQRYRWPMFGTGDVVGCGIDWTEKKNGEGVIFFTLNGLRLEPNLPTSSRRLYPAVGLQSTEAAVCANFGRDAFQYRAGKDEGQICNIVDDFEKVEVV